MSISGWGFLVIVEQKGGCVIPALKSTPTFLVEVGWTLTGSYLRRSSHLW